MAANWDDLKIVLAIGRMGSLTRAAQALGIDQSTAGRRLSTLEADLGTILFVRSKTGFTPTEAGEAVLARAGEVELRVERMMEDIARTEEGPVGVVRLLGNPWTLDRLTRIALPGFLAAHPRLDLRTTAYVPRSRAGGEATVSIWFEMPPAGVEFAIRLGEVPYAIFAARAADPAAIGWVGFHDEAAPRFAPTRMLDRLRVRGETMRFTATDAAILMTAARAGVGKALLPLCMGEEAPDLVRIGSGPPEMVRALHQHAHPDTVQNRRVQATIRWLRESFATVFLPRTIFP